MWNRKELTNTPGSHKASWKVDFTKKAEKAFQKLDPSVQIRIGDFFLEKILPSKNPFRLGKPLVGTKKNLWRYRVGHYRIICDIQKHEMTILTLTVGHRSDVYSEKF
jgi:mRNA interferase RelE/StbE